MSGFVIAGGVVHHLEPDLRARWWDQTDYQDAVVAASGAASHAEKRLVMGFEADLGRVMAAKTLGPELDAVLERYLIEDYRQHDPTIAQGRAGLARWLREVAVHFPGAPPPPVGLTASGDLVTVLLQVQVPPDAPGGAKTFFIVTLFRVRDGKLVEHWGGGGS